MNTDRIFTHETARKAIYSALSRIYCLPDEHLPKLTRTLAENFSHLNLSDAIHQCMLQELIAPEELKDLIVDFTRLFVGPYSPPALPYGSIYLEAGRKVMGNSTMDAASRYRRYGIQTAGTFRDVPDHISAEFEFMSFLIHREVELILAEDISGVDTIITEQNRFLNDHINAWVPEFTDLVIKNARMPFYRDLAGITKAFIYWDTDYLNQVRILETQN